MEKAVKNLVCRLNLKFFIRSGGLIPRPLGRFELATPTKNCSKPSQLNNFLTELTSSIKQRLQDTPPLAAGRLIKKISFMVRRIILTICGSFCLIFAICNCVGLSYESSNGFNSDSNTAVLASISTDTEKNSFVVYKYGDSMYINYFDYDKEKKKYDAKDLKEKKIVDININGEYKLFLIERCIFLLTSKTLYKVIIPEKVDDTTLIKTEIIAENIVNIWLYDNTCFYANAEGSLFLYDSSNNESLQYLDIEIDFAAKSIVILKTNDFIKALETSAKEWFDGFKNNSNEFVDNEFRLIGDDEALLQQYQMFININSNNVPSDNDFNTLDEWSAYLKNKYAEIQRENLAAEQEFEEKWGELNGQEPFAKDLEKLSNISIDSHQAKAMDASLYRGKNSTVIFLLSSYIKIIKTYYSKNVFSDGIKEMLKNNYNTIRDALNTAIKKEKETYEKSITEKDKVFGSNNNRFAEAFRGSLDRIKPKEYSFNNDFGYRILSMEGKTYYIVLYKSLNESLELDGFPNLGQNIYNLGFFDNNIYSVEDGIIKIYDPFTLTESQAVKYDAGTTDEKVLFAIDQNRGIFITLKQKGENKTYYIRELGNINENTLHLTEPGKIINNISSRKKTSYDEIFWSTAEFEDQYIYINSYKQKPQVNNNIDTEYVYIETPSGAGIIAPRS
jgi:hypothetical protein